MQTFGVGETACGCCIEYRIECCERSESNCVDLTQQNSDMMSVETVR